jgi:5-methylcytosine-specific restriction protein A
MARNPTWTEDELILALDLYFRAGRKWLPSDNPDVIHLSNILNSLPIHNIELRNTSYRIR